VGCCTSSPALCSSFGPGSERAKLGERATQYLEGRWRSPLDADEFIRRFLIHVLPSGFQRIRYYGLLGNRYRKDKLARCRELLGMSKLAPKADEGADKDYRDTYEEITGLSLLLPAGNRMDYLPRRTMSRRAMTRFIINAKGKVAGT
jgi:putative transposase